MELFLFLLFAGIALAGALGVVLAPNPVHSALSLVTVLISIAALFVIQDAQLLAAVQVIVYAGAIVVLFLFVIMLLGVDRSESTAETLRLQRPAAIVLGLALLVTLFILIHDPNGWAVGTNGNEAARGVLAAHDGNIKAVAQSLFTTFLWPFELTAVLLVIAVIGGVVLARRSHLPADEELLQLEEQDDTTDVEAGS
jgi:NADH-quinone oxidoreductase subunit J